MDADHSIPDLNDDLRVPKRGGRREDCARSGAEKQTLLAHPTERDVAGRLNISVTGVHVRFERSQLAGADRDGRVRILREVRWLWR